MNEHRVTLTTCAYCPNVCRPSYAHDDSVQTESQTPSALSLIMLAVLDGRLADDTETCAVLARRGAADASVGHCIYGLDIPAALDAALAERKTA